MVKYVGLIQEARSSDRVEELIEVSRVEGVDYDILRRGVACGRVIVPRNLRRKVKVVGVGEGMKTKVNVNIGTSGALMDIDLELRKLKVAIEHGTDTVMDLSTGGDLSSVRRTLIEASEGTPFGTVPAYQVWIEGVMKYDGTHFPEDYFLKVLEEHLKDGVDFMTIHAGITRELAEKAVRGKRLMPIVSRGGSMIAVWMFENDAENPFVKNWDYVLELFSEYDAVISLGDALRPGTLVDAHDELQIAELVNNARLAKLSVEKGVQVMIEGPGHMQLDKIAADIKLMKSLTGGLPYYVLGPLVTDIAPGYDHIVSAIGAAIAAAHGADLICYVTPAEHLSLPSPEQVRDGLIAAKIAAHVGDIVKLGERALSWDRELSVKRAELDWESQIKLSINPLEARRVREQYLAAIKSCTMCGQYCVFILLEKYRKGLGEGRYGERS